MPLFGIVGGRPIGATCDWDVGGRPCGVDAPFAIGFSARRETPGLWYCREHFWPVVGQVDAIPHPVRTLSAPAVATQGALF